MELKVNSLKTAQEFKDLLTNYWNKNREVVNSGSIEQRLEFCKNFYGITPKDSLNEQTKQVEFLTPEFYYNETLKIANKTIEVCNEFVEVSIPMLKTDPNTNRVKEIFEHQGIVKFAQGICDEVSQLVNEKTLGM